MNTVTVQELMDKVRLFCEEREWDPYHNPKDLCIGISTEANELLDIFRFQSEEQMRGLFQNPASREHIGEEVADTLFFLLRFAQMYGLDLETCLLDKLEKNARRYPVDKVKGKNQKC